MGKATQKKQAQAPVQQSAEDILREIMNEAVAAGQAYAASHPTARGRSAKSDPRNQLHPLPPGAPTPAANATTKPDGATMDGIVAYLKSYPLGTVVRKWGVGEHLFGSATKAREFLEAIKAEAAKAAQPIEIVQQEPILPVELPKKKRGRK